MAVIASNTRPISLDLISFAALANTPARFELKTDLGPRKPGLTNIEVTFSDSVYQLGDAKPEVDSSYSKLGTGVIGTGLTVDADNVLTGGTIKLAVIQSSAGALIGMVGLDLDAAELMAAAATATRADDRALLSRLLAGNDLILSLAGDDTTFGGGGNDLLSGGNGNDVLSGDAGNDALAGGKDADDLRGGDGHDLLDGGAGADRLTGGSGNDTMEGGSGDDTLIGAQGADVFVFGTGSGTDKVTDFSWKTDVIQLTSGAAGFDALTLVQVGKAVELRLGADVLILQGLRLDQLDADHFRFDGAVMEKAATGFLDGWSFLG